MSTNNPSRALCRLEDPHELRGTMEVLAKPSSELRDLLEDLEYEPESVSIPGLGDPITILTVGDLPLELLVRLLARPASLQQTR